MNVKVTRDLSEVKGHLGARGNVEIGGHIGVHDDDGRGRRLLIGAGDRGGRGHGHHGGGKSKGVDTH